MERVCSMFLDDTYLFMNRDVFLRSYFCLRYNLGPYVVRGYGMVTNPVFHNCRLLVGNSVGRIPSSNGVAAFSCLVCGPFTSSYPV